MYNDNSEENQQLQRGSLSTDSMSFSRVSSNKDIFDSGYIPPNDNSSGNNNKDKINFCESNIRLSFPQYMAKEYERLMSFNHPQWIKYIIDHRALSTAGFYYLGVDDKAKCFSCDCIIGDWNFIDQPWEEHAFWSPSCKFVLQQKGAIFVAAVQKRWSQHLKMLNPHKPRNLTDL